MPLWSEILFEISAGAPQDPRVYDAVRQKYLVELSEYTKRDTILYASSWVQRHDAPASQTTIVDEDIQALMEVTSDLHGPDLDLILHSPGGSPEVAEAIVSYLRSRFRNIRVIVPNLAMSAATMIACSANKIVMGKHSFLGPTDPQILIPTPIGVRSVNAQTVLDQFARVNESSKDREAGPAWHLLITQFGPDLIVRCENAIELSRALVKIWLENFMFLNDPNQKKKAEDISSWLAEHSTFKTHARHLSREILAEKGLAIEPLEHDNVLQDLSLSVFHAATIMFARFQVGKIVESHRKRLFMKSYSNFEGVAN